MVQMADSGGARDRTTGAMTAQSWRVTFARTGGIAGLTVTTEVDPTSSGEVVHEVQRVLDTVDLTALAARETGTGFPDGYRYDLAVERDGERVELRFWDGSVPDEIRPLVTLLTRQALNQPS
jgi:hypothetical protein